MKLALDWDGTVTNDPEMWKAVVAVMRAAGHQVYIVTMRYPSECDFREEWAPLVDGILATSRQPKWAHCVEQGLHIHVWMDDNPRSVQESALDIWGSSSPEGTVVTPDPVTGDLVTHQISPDVKVPVAKTGTVAEFLRSTYVNGVENVQKKLNDSVSSHGAMLIAHERLTEFEDAYWRKYASYFKDAVGARGYLEGDVVSLKGRVHVVPSHTWAIFADNDGLDMLVNKPPIGVARLPLDMRLWFTYRDAIMELNQSCKILGETSGALAIARNSVKAFEDQWWLLNGDDFVDPAKARKILYTEVRVMHGEIRIRPSQGLIAFGNRRHRLLLKEFKQLADLFRPD